MNTEQEDIEAMIAGVAITKAAEGSDKASRLLAAGMCIIAVAVIIGIFLLLY